MAAARAPLGVLLAALLLACGAEAAAASVAKPAAPSTPAAAPDGATAASSPAAPEDSATSAAPPAAPPDGSTAASPPAAAPDGATAAADMAFFMNECNVSFPTDTKLLSELNNSGSFRDETQEKPMCFLHCVFLKSGLVDDEGTFNAQRVRAAFGGGGEAADQQQQPKQQPKQQPTQQPKQPRQRRPQPADDAVASCILQRDESEHCRRVYGFVSCLMTEEIIRFGTPVNRGNRRAPQFS